MIVREESEKRKLAAKFLESNRKAFILDRICGSMRAVAIAKRKRYISIILIGTFFIFGSRPSSKTIAPTWSYKIEDITSFAMSRNGEYLIMACKKGSLCKEGQYYVFDRYGNIVINDCIENEIIVVDIANNGAFFVGTRTEYYFFSVSGKMRKDIHRNTFESVSISENGEIVIAGTNKEILIFDRNGIKNRKETGQSASFTAASASGNIAVAGAKDRIFLYDNSTNSWIERFTNETITSLAVSDDGSTIVSGMKNSFIWILDSKLDTQEEFPVPETIVNIAMTTDGRHLVCGTRQGDVIYFDSSGKEIWTRNIEDAVQEVAISSDGNFIAALCGDILLFNSLGNKLQELKASDTIQNISLSKFGDILSYNDNQELVFLELYQRHYESYPDEYMLPSRKSIPIEDELVELWSYEGGSSGSRVADVNGDGQNEIICNSAKEIAVLDSDGRILWKESFSFPHGINVLDVTGDLIPEIVVNSNDNRMGIQVFDGEGQELGSHEFYSRWYSEPPPIDPIRLIPVWSHDIDHDGFIEVVCLLSASYILEPRGFYAFEYPSFKEEWYYPVAPFLTKINLVDFNGDGQIEILAGSNAPCNGRQIGNTDDCHIYVHAVTLQGEELWTKQVGPGGFNRVYIAVADLNGDGIQEIVVGGWSYSNDWGKLFILNSEGKYILGENNEFDHSIFLLGVADLDNDGDSEILTATTSMLVLYDHELREIKRKDVLMTLNNLSYVKINDIDADDEKEIILTSEDEKLLILNANLEEEWSKIFPNYGRRLAAIVVNLNKCKNHLFIIANKLYVFTYLHNPDQPCALPSINLEMEIKEHISNGDMYFEGGNYLNAVEEYDLAIKKLQQIGNLEILPEITKKRTNAYEYSVKFAEAEQLLQESIYYLESQNLEKAEEKTIKAKKIYQSINRTDKVDESDDILYKINQLRLAGETIKKGEEEESQGNYKKAVEYYKQGLHIYEELGMTKEIEKSQEKIIELTPMHINTIIVEICFVAAFTFVTFFYFSHKAYKGEDKRINTIIYVATVVSLVGALMISLSAFSLPLGNKTYVLTFSMCLFFVMILIAYSRRL